MTLFATTEKGLVKRSSLQFSVLSIRHWIWKMYAVYTDAVLTPLPCYLRCQCPGLGYLSFQLLLHIVACTCTKSSQYRVEITHMLPFMCCVQNLFHDHLVHNLENKMDEATANNRRKLGIIKSLDLTIDQREASTYQHR